MCPDMIGLVVCFVIRRRFRCIYECCDVGTLCSWHIFLK